MSQFKFFKNKFQWALGCFISVCWDWIVDLMHYQWYNFSLEMHNLREKAHVSTHLAIFCIPVAFLLLLFHTISLSLFICTLMSVGFDILFFSFVHSFECVCGGFLLSHFLFLLLSLEFCLISHPHLPILPSLRYSTCAHSHAYCPTPYHSSRHVPSQRQTRSQCFMRESHDVKTARLRFNQERD